LRLIDFVYHSTLGLRVIKKKKKGHLRDPAAHSPYRLPYRPAARTAPCQTGRTKDNGSKSPLTTQTVTRLHPTGVGAFTWPGGPLAIPPNRRPHGSGTLESDTQGEEGLKLLRERALADRGFLMRARGGGGGHVARRPARHTASQPAAARPVFKAHRLLYHTTLGLRVIKKKKGHLRGPAARSSSRLPRRR